MSVLIDSGAFYALADESDRHSDAARAYFKRRVGDGDFVTTSAVLLETWTLLRNKLGWPAAQRFLDGIWRWSIEILLVEAADLDGARRILDQYSDQELSLVDATTFSLMERHGIVDVFTFDKDFLVYRFGRGQQRSFSCWP